MNPDYIKVVDNNNLVRDRKSNAIINVDNDSFIKYREERERLLKNQKTIEDVKNMKKDLEDIKEMLQQLLKK